jgi:hypothetical protein
VEAQAGSVANRVAPESWQGGEMIPTKTYPLSAIIGNQLTDKERIAELAEAFNKVCDENADFVAESIKADRRIAELEAEVKEVRDSGTALVEFLEKILKSISVDKNCSARIRAAAATIEKQIKAVREGK